MQNGPRQIPLSPGGRVSAAKLRLLGLSLSSAPKSAQPIEPIEPMEPNRAPLLARHGRQWQTLVQNLRHSKSYSPKL